MAEEQRSLHGDPGRLRVRDKPHLRVRLRLHRDLLHINLFLEVDLNLFLDVDLNVFLDVDLDGQSKSYLENQVGQSKSYLENQDLDASEKGKLSSESVGYSNVEDVGNPLNESVGYSNVEDVENLDELQDVENLDELQDVENLDELYDVENLDELYDVENLDELYDVENLDELEDVGAPVEEVGDHLDDVVVLHPKH